MIYLDHAATTKLAPEVLAAMLPYLGDQFGNASSIYSLGREARRAIDEARDLTAAFLGARPKEILFTSGGSEADNLAIRGVAWASKNKGNHLITSQVEHSAVMNTCRSLEKQGFEVTYLPPDRAGRVAVEQVREAINERTVLISIMHANNEVGTLQPVAEIGALARERRIPFHTDAVQAVGQLPVRVHDLNADLLSISAHKIYGPKGVGALYVRTGVRITPVIAGGDQEFGRRAGTENVAGIVGLGKALERIFEELPTVSPRMERLRDRLIEGLLVRVPACELTGDPVQRAPNHASFLFRHIEGEPLLHNLDMRGIAASSGSACASGSVEPSHVLLAMGFTVEEAHGALRLTLGRESSDADVDAVLTALPPLVEELRAMSPAWAATRARSALA